MTEVILYVFFGYLISAIIIITLLSIRIANEYDHMHKFLVERKQIQDFQDWKLARRLQLKQLNPIE